METELKKRRTASLAILIALTAGLRLLYWFQVRDQTWFLFPGMDPEFYLTWARDILQGKGAAYIPFPRAPLYSYLLAGLLKLFGQSWIIPRLLNLSADLATMVFVYLTGRKLSDHSVGLTAAIIYAMTGAGIYFSGEILMESLATAMVAALVYTLVVFQRKPNYLHAVSSGLILAVFALFRPNAILLLPVTAFIIYIYTGTIESFNRRLFNPLLHFLTFLIVLTPILVINWRAASELIPVSTQGGVNFYIGNARGANGWSSNLPGIGANWTDADARLIAENDAGEALTSSQVSRQFWLMGWHEIAADPVDWMKLECKKLLLLFNACEIGNNRPLALPAEAAPILKVLFLISLGTMFPLALIGLFRSGDKAGIGILAGFILAFSASLLLFFINTRYRMPLLPAFAVLTALGLQTIRMDIKHRRSQIPNAALLIIGCIIALPPWSGSDFNDSSQVAFVQANALLRAGRAEEAIKLYRGVEGINPGYPELNLNLGAAKLAAGDTTGAEAAFRRELQLNPTNARAENNLGVIAEGQGRIEEALEYYHQALEFNRFLEDARINEVRIFLRLGDREFQNGLIDLAENYYRQAVDLSVDDPRPRHRLALVAASKEEWDKAEAWLKEALKISPAYQPARDMLEKMSNAGF